MPNSLQPSSPAHAARLNDGSPLSPFQRGMICIAIALACLGWWFMHRAWSEDSGVDITKTSLSSEFCEAMGLLKPERVSFQIPENKVVDGRRVLMVQPPALLDWIVPKETKSLSFTYGFDPVAYEQGTTNGADLILERVDAGRHTEIFRRRLEPKKTPADRGVQHAAVPLATPISAQTHVILRTEPGEFGDGAWDWIYVGSFKFEKS